MIIDEVANVLREVGAETIMPRFQQLQAAEVSEKSPGEVVTAVDRESEALLTSALLRLQPSSRVIGEEACAEDPSILKHLEEGAIWLVDPLDGTSNFASGHRPFSVMVALLQDGETVLSWMLDPVSGELCVAERGSGATINGIRVVTSEPDLRRLKGAILNKFMPPGVRDRIATPSKIFGSLPGMFCAGAEYPAIANGESDF
jgi:fructose-1,6-bisphosphatase/inositol monophosphatase family enzyme